MFKTDEDDDEDATMGAVRYQVMPSLVALQQMRNRLHLAYLGRKLMKWTALATGKELRRIAMNIAESLENYAEQMCTAYILLARARYFIPKLNDVVLETIPSNASSNIGVTSKSISGVKITKFSLQETGFAPYPFLGIEKGGKAIYDTKQAWLDLLKLMIKILQERVTFKAVETAHKNATLRMKMLARVVIPKILATIKYIISELEDRSREDLIRMIRLLGVIEKVEERTKDVEKAKIKVPKRLPGKEVPEAIGSESLVSYSKFHFMSDCDLVIKEEKQSVISADDDVDIEHFKVQISENLNDIKEIEEKGIANTRVDEFVKPVEELKGKFQLKADELERTLAEPFYNFCGYEFETKTLVPKKIKLKATMDIIEIRELIAIQEESKVHFKLSWIQSPSILWMINVEFGTFETIIKKVSRILGVENKDGIIEETKVINIKKQTRVRIKPPPLPINSVDNSCRLMYKLSKNLFISDLYSMKDSNNTRIN